MVQQTLKEVEFGKSLCPKINFKIIKKCKKIHPIKISKKQD